jgi:hypothetical protein
MRGMTLIRSKSRWGALLPVAIATAAPAYAFVVTGFPALTKLERGKWVIRGGDGTERALCLREPVALVQLEHRGLACSGEVVASDGDGGTVQYDCPGRGYGHTSIRVETPRLARIDTQGLIDGRPFAYRAEARKTGAC